MCQRAKAEYQLCTESASLRAYRELPAEATPLARRLALYGRALTVIKYKREYFVGNAALGVPQEHRFTGERMACDSVGTAIALP